MEKLKAKPIPNNKGTYYIEVQDGEEKVLVGKGESFRFIEYCEWDTEEEAIKWIELKDRLELNV